MNEMQREKILYRYTNAVERGDMDTVAAILRQAEDDPELEQMILEINRTLSQELPPSVQETELPVHGLRKTPEMTIWQHIRLILRGALRFGPAFALGGLLVFVFFYIALLGPAVGNIFSNISSHLPEPMKAPQRPGIATPTPYFDTSKARMLPPGGESTAYPGPYDDYSQQATYAAAMEYPAPNTAFATSALETPQARLVVRNSYLSMVVADTRRARDAVKEIVSTYAGEGAYILTSVEEPIGGSSLPRISIQLRVPVSRYDTVMDRLVRMALSVNSRQETAQDVTDEYVDVQARIDQLEVTIERLTAIMKDAQSTEDLLAIEKQLTDREVELEALKGRAKYLEGTAALSLIQVVLNPVLPTPTFVPTRTPTPVPQWQPGKTVTRSANTLLHDLRSFVDGLIAFAIIYLPWLILIGLVIFGVARLARWMRKKL
jgi:hypothetical protein